MEYTNYDFKPLPPDLIVYKHQIGGHGLINVKLGKILHGEDDTIYKPIQAFPKGRTEIEFYRTVFDSVNSDPILAALRAFIPQWRGLYFDSETKTRYLRLQDVLSGLQLPNVADIKIGAVSFVPDASASKIAVEKAKYLWREEVGFLITGMKVYNSEKNGYDYFDRAQGRRLDPEQVYTHGIRLLVGPSPKRALLLAKSLLTQLLAIRKWFYSQMSYAFYASSLLLAYDGLKIEGSSADRTVVKLVDFTRTVSVNKRDDNFLFGLNNLIKNFERLIDTEVSAPYIVEAVNDKTEITNNVVANYQLS